MITLVTGLPRSGTTMVTTMLVRGAGLPSGCGDYPYEADWTNLDPWPKRCVQQAQGKVVKVLDPLLHGPNEDDGPFRVIVMTRNPREQAKSTVQFARALQLPGATARYRKHFEANVGRLVRETREMFEGWGCKVLLVSFERTLRFPLETAQRLSAFLDLPHATHLPMVSCVLPRGPKCNKLREPELLEMFR